MTFGLNAPLAFAAINSKKSLTPKKLSADVELKLCFGLFGLTRSLVASGFCHGKNQPKPQFEAEAPDAMRRT